MALSDPAYLKLLETGELAQRAAEAAERMVDCALCGRQCHADRLSLEGPPSGSFCRTGRYALVSGAFPHHGEEGCLRGTHGSGTIFFAHCSLRCVFCQNYDVSWIGQGCEVGAEELASMMLRLASQGCHNINLVTPSHVVPHILAAVAIAAERGLRLPLVYNTGAYDSLEGLRLLDGVIDIYMPDFKFWAPEVSDELAQAPNYAQIARHAIKEMHRQVGDLVIDEQGLARRGLLVRHLIMPNHAAGTRGVMRFLAREISPNTFVNLIAEYRPEGQACRFPSINRHPTLDEIGQALAIAYEEGLRRFHRR